MTIQLHAKLPNIGIRESIEICGCASFDQKLFVTKIPVVNLILVRISIYLIRKERLMNKI